MATIVSMAFKDRKITTGAIVAIAATEATEATATVTEAMESQILKKPYNYEL